MSAYKDAALVLSTLCGTSLLIRSYIRSAAQAAAPARSWNWGCLVRSFVGKLYAFPATHFYLALYLVIADPTNSMINLGSLVGTE